MTLIAVIEGDGIGREVTPAALTVLKRTGLDLAIDACARHLVPVHGSAPAIARRA